MYMGPPPLLVVYLPLWNSRLRSALRACSTTHQQLSTSHHSFNTLTYLLGDALVGVVDEQLQVAGGAQLQDGVLVGR